MPLPDNNSWDTDIDDSELIDTPAKQVVLKKVSKKSTKKPRTKRSSKKAATKSTNYSPVVKLPRSVKNWSTYQQDMFKDTVTGIGHTVVVARAGSGKTASIVESLYHVPPNNSILTVAFNKKIRDALLPLVPDKAECSTLHSLGLRSLSNAVGKTRLDDNKSYDIIGKLIGTEWEKREYTEQIRKTVSLAKGHLYDTEEQLDELIDKYDIDAGKTSDRKLFISLVQQTLITAKKQTNVIDFDDMIYLVNVLNITPSLYDRVFIDETQDLNTAQIQLALKSLRPGGRICAVGDPNQSCYGFRGADSQAIPNIINTLSAKTLPLSISYRCAKSIIKLAQEIVPDIQHADNAIEGSIESNNKDQMIRDAKPGDVILSRVNAPLVGLCMAFLRQGRPANIQGRDVGAGLIAMIKKSKAKSVEAFKDYIEYWQLEEVDRLTKKRRDVTAVLDKAECLTTLCEGATSLHEVQSNINRLFVDVNDSSRITLSSIHRSKGLEWDKVFVLKGTLRRGSSDEEDNLFYIAVTRARKTLVFVTY